MGKTPYGMRITARIISSYMQNYPISQSGDRAAAPLPRQTRPVGRILVVDDDIFNRQLVTEVLIQSGYEVDGAADGAAGCEALAAKHYDLLITANFMPKVTGVEMISRFRSQGSTVRVIMATGTIPTEELKRHPQLEISAFLLKPYTVVEMLTKVREVLRQADGASGGLQKLLLRNGEVNRLWPDRVPARAPGPAQPGLPHRILVVEDDISIRLPVTDALVRSGYQVDAAEDGAVAWEALQAKRYDLIITDNSMPKVTGVDLLKKLHAAGTTLPVIMATSTLPKEEFTRYPCIQPTAMLLKPYSFHELLGTVRNVLCAASP